jgi:hypothetical protein
MADKATTDRIRDLQHLATVRCVTRPTPLGEETVED